MTVPHITEECVNAMAASGIEDLRSMVISVDRKPEVLAQILKPIIGDRPAEQALEVS